MRVQLVVADRSAARFFNATTLNSPLELVNEITDPLGRLQDQEMQSDRPGRLFNSAAGRDHRGGAAPYQTSRSEKTPKKHEAEVFARKVIEELQNEHRKAPFKRLVVMAGPSFLGLLRQEMPASLSKLVVSEINKDLIHQDESAVRAHLSPEIFQELL